MNHYSFIYESIAIHYVQINNSHRIEDKEIILLYSFIFKLMTSAFNSMGVSIYHMKIEK